MDDEKQSAIEQKQKEEAVVEQTIDAVQDILEQYSASSRHRRGRGVAHKTPYGQQWKPNDILCCLVNIEKKYVEFFLNNKSMGIAFKDIEFNGNVYISITLQNAVNCILLNNKAIDINDESKWEIEGDIDVNDASKIIEIKKKIIYDDSVNVDELKEGDKIIMIHNDEIIESEIERINRKTRKMMIRLDGWKWISMDSDQLFPSKDVVNTFFDEMNQKTTKLGRKLYANDGFPTATLKIPVNSLGEFKYEVLICSKDLAQIGFSDDSFKPNDVKGDGCGDDDHSWAFDGFRVLKWGKKSEQDSKISLTDYDGILPKDFVYDYKKDYTHAIKRALYATQFLDISTTLKWFAEHWKDESIYLPITNKELEDTAARHKEEGNKLFKMKKYYKAIIEYDNAIWYGLICEMYKDLDACYSNRSIALSKVYEYELALVDAKKCILLNKTWSKGYLRKGHALMKLYKFDESIEAYKEGIKLCDKSEHKLLKLGLNTAVKYKQIMSAKEKQREKIKFIICPLPTEENMRKEMDDGIKKVEAIHINYGKMYTFKDLIRFDTFGWNLVDNDNEDEKKRDDDIKDCMVWKCDNYPVVLTATHYKKECDIKKKPIDVNMFSIRHIQRDNLLKSGINSGLILSENFEVCTEPSIYGVEVLIKTIIVADRPSSGYIYWIKIPFKNEYFELKLETTYQGQTTGNRDSMMLIRLSNALKVNPIELMNMNVWTEDPYDSLYTQGALMNLSERQEYDALFPYHPLSILRSKLMKQFKDSVTINSEKASKMYNL